MQQQGPASKENNKRDYQRSTPLPSHATYVLVRTAEGNGNALTCQEVV